MLKYCHRLEGMKVGLGKVKKKWFQAYNALFINHADGLIEYNYFK
jgi:hypothetical protein